MPLGAARAVMTRHVPAAPAGYQALGVSVSVNTRYGVFPTSISNAIKTATVSGWIRPTNNTGNRTILGCEFSGSELWLVNGALNFIGRDGTGATTNTAISFAYPSVFPLNTWGSFTFSFDTATSTLNAWMNHSPVTPAGVVFNNLPLRWSRDTDFFCYYGGSSYFLGDVADLYVIQGAVATDVNLFSTAANKPVDLGATGTAPGLGSPMWYFSRRTGTATEFAANKGTAGGLTLRSGGPIANSTTSPSD